MGYLTNNNSWKDCNNPPRMTNSQAWVAALWPLLVLITATTGQTENRNFHLRIGSIESEPFLRNVDGEGNAAYEGFIKDLLEEISTVQGFSYELILSVDNKYGVDNGGNWSGLVGMLQRGEIDMIAADLTVTWSRMSAIDFSKPFLASTLTLLLKDPSEYSVLLSSWFNPFSWEVWLLLLASYLFSSLVLCLTAKVSPLEHTAAAKLSLKDSFWYLIACWFRASPFHPKAWSTRLVSCAWWMFYVTMIFTYFLHLPPHLATPTTAARPSTVQDVLDMGVSFGVVRGGSTFQLLKNSHNPLHQALWDSISTDYEASIIASYNTGMERVNNDNGTFCMVMESTAAQYLTAQDCSLYNVGSLEDRHYAFGFPKGSRYRRMFSQGLLQMTETGKLSAAKYKWWPDPSDCPQLTTSSLADQRTTLTMEHMAPPLLFLLVALILALILSLLELCTSTKISSLPKYLSQSFSPSLPKKNSSFQKFSPSVATQTVLWASSRATTPAPGGAGSPPPLYHRIYTHDGKLSN